MMIIMFTVECPVHGKMEVCGEQNNSSSSCPITCFVPIGNGAICGQPLKRIYDVPNVHFKGDGFTKTSR
jgi:hypothetical protein